MTKKRKNSYRMMSLITAFLLVMSCFSLLLTRRASADNGGITVTQFEMKLLSGARLTNGKYVWTPSSGTVNAGHRFRFRVTYAFSGTGNIPSRGVDITVPSTILKDMYGNKADKFEISVPKEGQGDGRQELAYYIDGSDIHVFNPRKISAAQHGYFEIAYITTKTTFYYTDMGESSPCGADMQITGDAGSASAETDSTTVYIDTDVKITSAQMSAPGTFYQDWQSEWGEAPENADDYYYLVWTVGTYITATQYYYFDLTGFEKTGTNFSFVGYRLQEWDKFWTYHGDNEGLMLALKSTNGYRCDYILTRHEKNHYEPIEQYQLEISAYSRVTPRFDIANAITACSSAVYYYDTPVFVRPHGTWNAWKYGTTSWNEHFGYEWPVADYRLQELKEGKYPYLDGDLRFCVYATSGDYSLTVPPGESTDDWHNYGLSDVTYTITDELFYFMDDIETHEEVLDIPEGTEPITSDDYEIEYLTYTVKLYDADFNEEVQRFVQKAGEYTPDDVIHIDAKFGGSTEWIEDAAVYSFLTGEAQRKEQYVESADSRKIVFAPGCTGYRVRMSNTHYRTNIEVLPYCKLKGSEHVKELIGDSYTAWLSNRAFFAITDSQGTVCHSKELFGRDYLSGLKKVTHMDKVVSGVQNDVTKQAAKVNWGVSLYESYLTDGGIEYVTQETGTFYDLLPIGCEPVEDSVTIINKTDPYSHLYQVNPNDNVASPDIELDSSEFSCTFVHDYNGTGRTLMIIRVLVRFDRAELTYSTYYSWDSIIDYGTTLLNSVAYRTGNSTLGNGFPDDGGEIVEADLMKGLDEETVQEIFFYAEGTTAVDVSMSASLGLSKKVKSADDPYYTASANIRQDSTYSYNLRYASDENSSSKGIIFYDSIESYSDGTLSSDFTGTLQSVNTLQPEMLGADPVVYLSSVRGLDMTTPPDLDARENGQPVWVRMEDFGDISGAAAVAVDLTRDTEGEEFILVPGRSVTVILNMKAPVSDTSGKTDPAAYNGVYLSSQVIDDEGRVMDFYTYHNYTTVHYRVASDIEILKKDKTDDSVSIKGIRFTLEGISDYGTAVSKSLYTDKDGHITFSGIEKGVYTLTETATTEDYQINLDPHQIVVNDDGAVLMDGQSPSENGSFVITDEPRVHAAVTFSKRTFAGTKRLINGAVFELWGQSDYGNEITLYSKAVSGKVNFNNVEKGTYRLKEVRPPEGYLENDTVYIVNIDSGGMFTIVPDSGQEGGDPDSLSSDDAGAYSVYNEPLHSFSIIKQGYTYGMPIGGAVFELSGTSDRGNAVSLQAPTATNGTLTFRSLESGTYTLREVSAPEGYLADDAVRIVTIDKYDNITIEGLEKDTTGYFVVTDKENSTVTIIKKWVDPDSSGRYENTSSSQDDSGQQEGASGTRGGNRDGGTEDGSEPILPDISISSQVPGTYAVFAGTGLHSVLSNLASLSQIKSFAPFAGSDQEAQALIETAVLLDDNTTGTHIYGWFDSATGAVTWWSDARKVYLSDDSHYLWYGLSACTSIDVSGIDTSRVTDMSQMFSGDAALDSLDLSGFETSRVTDMSFMFSGCGVLADLDISNFNTSNVHTMASMFNGCKALSTIDISGFDSSKVTSLDSMFYECAALGSLDLSRFTAPFNTSMSNMFYGCNALTELDLRNMQTSNVTDMSGAFYKCQQLQTVDLRELDLSSAMDMKNLFREDTMLKNVYLDSLYAPNVTTLYTSFYKCSSLETIDFSRCTIAGVTDMTGMFGYCTSLKNVDLSGLDATNVTSLYQLFRGCTSLKSLDLTGFNTKSAVDMRAVFYQCSGLESIEMGDFSTESATDLRWLFYGCTALKEVDVTGFDTSNVTNMYSMFNGCSSLTELDVSSFDTSNVTNFGYMFRICEGLKELDVSNFDVYRAEYLDHMFQYCTGIKVLDLTNFYTASAIDMQYMFNNCHSLEHLYVPNFYTAKVTVMSGMIADCWPLKEIDLSSFDVSNVTSLNGFLYQAQELEYADLSSFHTVSNKDCANMFYKDYKLREIILTGFDLTKTTTIYQMFLQNSALTTIYVSDTWNASSVGNSTNMFSGCTNLVGQAGTPYSASYTNKTYARIDSADTPGYLTFRQASYPTEPQPEPRMTNYTYFGSEGDGVSVLSRVCDISQIKSFRRYTGNIPEDGGPEEIEAAQAAAEAYVEGIILAGRAVRVDDGQQYNPPIYAWLDDDGVLWYYTKAHNIYLTDSSRFLWTGLSGCGSIQAEDIDTSQLTTMNRMFQGCSSLTSLDIHGFNTKAVTDMSYMFSGCSSLTDLNISGFASTALTDIAYMFSGCSSMKSISIPFNTKNITDMSGLYSGCTSAESIKWTNTSSVQNMSRMFEDCSSLRSLDIPVAYTSSVTDMSYMFSGCTNLTDLNTRSFDTSSVTTMKAMFRDCSSMITFSVNGFDLSSNLDMSEMFSGCTSMTVLDLGQMAPSAVTDMSGMFDGCGAVGTIYATDSWNTDLVTSSDNMFRGCSSLTGSNGTEFDPTRTDAGMAFIDRPGQTGYLSDKSYLPDTTVFTPYSDNCTVDTSDEDTWIFTFTDLDPNTPFYVWEGDYEGYDTDTPIEGYRPVTNGEAVIINTKRGYDPPRQTYGSLTVSKTVTGEDLTYEDLQRTFLFTVTLTDEEDHPLTGNTVYGTTAFADGTPSFRLGNGDSLTMTDIPSGYHYTVTEQASDDFDTSSEGSAGVISQDTPAAASFTNTKLNIVQKTNSFTLKKVVDGNFELNTASYDFTVSLDGLAPESSYYLSDGSTFTSDRQGSATVQTGLKDGETVSFEGLPVGSTYRINEAAGDYTSAFVITNASEEGSIFRSHGMNTEKETALSTSTETVDEDEEILVTFTNTMDIRQNLTVKKVTETNVAGSDTFRFRIEMEDLVPGEQMYAEGIGRFQAEDDGTLELDFYLSSGGQAVFKNVPVNARYRVTETASDYIASYLITDSNGLGKIVSPSGGNTETGIALATEWETVNEGENALVTFTNVKTQRDITVTKKIDMTYGNLRSSQYSKEQFAFTAVLSGLDPDTPYTVEYSGRNVTGILSADSFTSSHDGKATYSFLLSSGRSCTIKNLPEGASYQVTESPVSFYVATYAMTGSEGAYFEREQDANTATNTSLTTAAETVEEEELSVEIVFTNVYNASDYVLPEAGTDDTRVAAAAALGGMLLFAVTFAFVTSRRKGRYGG